MQLRVAPVPAAPHLTGPTLTLAEGHLRLHVQPEKPDFREKERTMQHRIGVTGTISEVKTAIADFNRRQLDQGSAIADRDWRYRNRDGGGWVYIDLSYSGALLRDIAAALDRADLIA